MAIRRPFDRIQFLLSIGLALGIVLVILAFTGGVTGKAASGLPVGIELTEPRDGSRQLRQASVQVRLSSGYAGKLIINAVDIPVDVLAATDTTDPQRVTPRSKNTVFDPGNSTLTYQPQSGALIDKFGPGTQTVRVEYWRIATPDVRLTYNYTFIVEA
jgi:hypothetical protein